ncbi:TPA: hypothetical protein QC364_000760 [Bacillus cereus]|nr:hypothetical protein [Bacillus cereus]
MNIEISKKWQLNIIDGGHGSLTESLRTGGKQIYEVFVGYDNYVYVSEADKNNIGHGIIPKTVRSKISSVFKKYRKNRGS